MAGVDLDNYQPEFHGTDAPYILPSDLTERERLKAQSDAWKAVMHGNVFHAPVENPKTIVDIGCGPGKTTRDLASKYPDSQVYGIDIISMPEEHANPPSNLEFISGDARVLMAANGDSRIPPGCVDYAFQRLLVCGMSKWPDYIQGVVDSVKSGGWVEIHEWNFQVFENGSNATDDWHWQQEMCRKAAEIKGLDLRCAEKLEGWLKEAGLTDVHTVAYEAPIGPWSLKEHPEHTVIVHYLAKWWSTVSRILLDSVFGNDQPDYCKKLTAEMEESLKLADRKQSKAYQIMVCYGKKP